MSRVSCDYLYLRFDLDHFKHLHICQLAVDRALVQSQGLKRPFQELVFVASFKERQRFSRIPHGEKMIEVWFENIKSECLDKTSRGKMIENELNGLLELSMLFLADRPGDLKEVNAIRHGMNDFMGVYF
jgi:hypothetical protein